MNLGTLYVKLNADSQALVKGMAKASEAVEKFAKETKKLANDVAGVAGAMLALGGAAVKMASTVDTKAARSVEQLQGSLALVAVQIYDVLAPAVDALTRRFKQLADWIANIDPETKKQIATWAIWIAQLAVAAKVIGTVSGLVSGVSGAFSSLFKVIASVGAGPILAIIGTLAAVIAAVIFLHRAWRKNWGGIQEITKGVFENLGKAVAWLGDLFSSLWGSIVDGAQAAVLSFLNIVDAAQQLTGVKLVDTSALREGFAGLFKDLKTGSFFANALTFAKETATEVGDAVTEEIAIIRDEITAALGIGGGGGSNTGARAPQKAATKLVAEQKIDWKGNEDELEKKASKLATDLNDASRKMWDERSAFEEKAFADYKEARDAANKAYWAQVDNEKAIDDERKNIAEQSRSKLKATMGIILDGTGALGETIKAISAGAQSGGVWGAIIAAIMQVFQRMESFQSLLKIFEQGLVRLGEFLEPLFGPIFKIVEQLTVVGTEILAPVFKALQPLFEMIAKAAQKLVPILSILGTIFDALAPVIEAVIAIGDMFNILEPVLDLIGGVVKVIATVILGFLVFLNEIAAAFGDEKARAEADRLKAKIDKMWAPNADALAQAEADAATSAWHNAAAQQAAADSASDVAESLSNVPSGYKLALSRFNADNGEGAYRGLMGSGASPGGGSTTNNTTVIQGDVIVNTEDGLTAAQIAEQARKERARERAQRGGNPADPRD